MVRLVDPVPVTTPRHSPTGNPAQKSTVRILLHGKLYGENEIEKSHLLAQDATENLEPGVHLSVEPPLDKEISVEKEADHGMMSHDGTPLSNASTESPASSPASNASSNASWRKGKEPLARVLHRALCVTSKTNPDIMSWTDDGKAFRINKDHEDFPRILKRFFKYPNVKSFCMALNAQRFRLIRKGIYKGCHFMPFFNRDNPDYEQIRLRQAPKMTRPLVVDTAATKTVTPTFTGPSTQASRATMNPETPHVAYSPSTQAVESPMYHQFDLMSPGSALPAPVAAYAVDVFQDPGLTDASFLPLHGDIELKDILLSPSPSFPYYDPVPVEMELAPEPAAETTLSPDAGNIGAFQPDPSSFHSPNDHSGWYGTPIGISLNATPYYPVGGDHNSNLDVSVANGTALPLDLDRSVSLDSFDFDLHVLHEEHFFGHIEEV